MTNHPGFSMKQWLNEPWFILLLFSFFLFLSRLFLSGQRLEIDETEQITYAQHLLRGYPAQPPLYSWLQYGVFQLLGINLCSLALLKYTLLFGCLYYFHQICRLHCSDNTLAWCATLAWALIPAISLDLIKDNTHTVLALLTACITWYWFTAPSSHSPSIWYLRLGFIVGCGLLAKFNYALFLFILVVSALSVKEFRAKLINWHLLLSLIVIILFTFPYVIWLYNNADVGLSGLYKIAPKEKTRLHGIGELLKTCFFFAAPPLIISSLFFSHREYFEKTIASSILLRRFHAVTLPLLLFIVLALGFRDFETRWLIPILFLCPLLIFSQLKPTTTVKSKVKQFIIVCLMVQCVLVLAVIHRSYHRAKTAVIIEGVLDSKRVTHH
jgi:4-amino-4-deoxy-L-arabinose transferase-like glycosyltransferase